MLIGPVTIIHSRSVVTSTIYSTFFCRKNDLCCCLVSPLVASFRTWFFDVGSNERIPCYALGRMSDPETIARFILLRSQGCSFNQIADELKVSKPTLIKWS